MIDKNEKVRVKKEPKKEIEKSFNYLYPQLPAV